MVDGSTSLHREGSPDHHHCDRLRRRGPLFVSLQMEQLSVIDSGAQLCLNVTPGATAMHPTACGDKRERPRRPDHFVDPRCWALGRSSLGRTASLRQAAAARSTARCDSASNATRSSCMQRINAVSLSRASRTSIIRRQTSADVPRTGNAPQLGCRRLLSAILARHGRHAGRLAASFSDPPRALGVLRTEHRVIAEPQVSLTPELNNKQKDKLFKTEQRGEDAARTTSLSDSGGSHE